jgi:ABC-type bacteriocin/lantibiotic exporter with double-glycine peptidase domain
MRRFLAPEIIQTSATDCGPASLKCVLEGYGIAANYGRLREACQTDIDGSSISTIGDVAVQLGLQSEEIILPLDHLLIDEAQAVPAVVVARLPNGFTHFLVVWRRHGKSVQVMDPAIGRRWLPVRRLLSELYVHQTVVPAADWREWAGTDQFVAPLRRRISQLGVPADSLIETAKSDATWHTLAMLDASIRAAEAMCRNGGLRRGAEAQRLIERLLAVSAEDAAELIPTGYWSARRCETAEGEEECVRIRGAVLLRLRGKREVSAQTEGPLCAATVVAVGERSATPWHELYRLVRQEGRLTIALLIAALGVASAGVVVEALIFRGILDLGRYLGVFEQRAAAVAALMCFAVALFLLDIPLASGALRAGRRLECQLRLRLFEKLARLPDRYFRSRLTSDMVERSHSTHMLRNLVMLASRVMRAAARLAITAAALCWLDPRVAFPAIVSAIAVVAIPLMAAPLVNERELRVRTHSGALSRFSLDALLGLTAIRSHSAERPVRRQHESLLVEWMHAGLSLHRAVSLVESLQTAAVFALVGWIVLAHVAHAGPSGLNLLLVFWALSLPVLGQEIAIVLRQAPTYRNITARLLEPLSAPEDALPASAPEQEQEESNGGVRIAYEQVTVRIAGRDVLKDIDLLIPPGSHVAIVGPSGAGKSTLVGALLGFHRPVAGRIQVGQHSLDESEIERVRRMTAWVDPAVHLWNRSLLANIRYGAGESNDAVGEALQAADLADLLAVVPQGLQTELGEGGALVSGGEGQRVRLARAMFRPDVRLVILDEPFRGLDRERRRDLLLRSRSAWRNATLLCITHDIAETTLFDRVIVVDGGRIVEQGEPSVLAKRTDSRYRSLLNAEATLTATTWSSSEWRRLRMSGGVVIEDQKVVEEVEAFVHAQI